jgi:hypothetical protein
MLNSKILGALAVVAVLSTVGVGYAVTTSTIYMVGSASAAGVSIAWVESSTGAPTTLTTGSASDCIATYYSTEVFLTASDLASGAVCDIYDTSVAGNSLNITNTGGFAVTLNDTISCTPTCTPTTPTPPYQQWDTASGCWAYQDANTYGAAPLPVTLNPGGVYPGAATYGTYGIHGWFADIYLSPSGTGCAGSSFSVTVTFTGTST